MKIDKYLIIGLFGFVLYVTYVLGVRAYKLHDMRETEETRYYRIDSISSRLKYEVMPEKIYTYHTAFGPISGPRDRYQVGDSIQIKIITHKK
jgi:hypothetical protein